MKITMITRDQVLDALRDVEDPELHKSIVELDMVQDIGIHDGRIKVDALLTISGCPLRETIVESIRTKVAAIPGVREVEVNLGVMNQDQRQTLIAKLHGGDASPQRRSSFLTPETPTRIIAVASGKGGVGKSTVTVNVAAAIAQRGHKVGIIDADVYGFSIPKMLGVHGRPTLIDQMIIPLEKHGIRVISIGFMLPDEDQAVIWRGPLLHKTLTTFIGEVHWGEDLEYLLLDLPPGTGDVSLTIAQTLPQSYMLLVTTPQEAAAQVARRAAKMAEKVNMEVVGVIENMSFYRPVPDAPPVYIFGQGGGAALATQLEVPLFAEIPLDPAIREGSDRGMPVVLSAPDSPAGQAFRQAADALLSAVPVLARV
jgi:ATP-binding protein involved in chromosome partitioning